MTSQGFSIVVAATRSGGIGVKGSLPWRLPGDMAFFKKTTLDAGKAGGVNAVVMGRKTWQSIPERFRPLPGRINIVLSRRAETERDALCAELGIDASASVEMDGGAAPADAVFVESSVASGLARAGLSGAAKTFVIGGAEIYAQAMRLDALERVILTRVHLDDDACPCDAFLDFKQEDFRVVDQSAVKTDKKTGTQYEFMQYERVGAVPTASGAATKTPSAAAPAAPLAAAAAPAAAAAGLPNVEDRREKTKTEVSAGMLRSRWVRRCSRGCAAPQPIRARRRGLRPVAVAKAPLESAPHVHAFFFG